MFVVQMVNFPASVKIKLPFLRRESFERCPLTGWSRFAIQTMVRELLNHMAKQKAFSPSKSQQRKRHLVRLKRLLVSHWREMNLYSKFEMLRMRMEQIMQKRGGTRLY